MRCTKRASRWSWPHSSRCLLIDLRRCLHTEFPSTHDCTSITAYTSLPPDFDDRLPDVQIRRAMSNINVALSFADDVTKRFSSRFSGKAPSGGISPEQRQAQNERLLDLAKSRVLEAKSRLAQLLARHARRGPKIRGYLASTEKREAALRFEISRISRLTDTQRAQSREDSLLSLERARVLYWEAFVSNRSGYWAVVQYLSLTLLLQHLGRLDAAAELAGQAPAALWDLAEVQSIGDARNPDQSEREWALGNLIELYILAPMVAGIQARHPANALQDLATDRAKELVASAGAASFEVFSTRRQVIRYLDWYSELGPVPLPDAVRQIAEAVLAWLPERDDPDWRY